MRYVLECGVVTAVPRLDGDNEASRAARGAPRSVSADLELSGGKRRLVLGKLKLCDGKIERILVIIGAE